ncbi:hypothetical protein [Streptomyces sp. N35]|uniref:hypothetical protein n=1 Tax=Streptomyces sp. N35 TaxID=2795730 RepID=UPI0018F5BDD9
MGKNYRQSTDLLVVADVNGPLMVVMGICRPAVAMNAGRPTSQVSNALAAVPRS